MSETDTSTSAYEYFVMVEHFLAARINYGDCVAVFNCDTKICGMNIDLSNIDLRSVWKHAAAGMLAIACEKIRARFPDEDFIWNSVVVDGFVVCIVVVSLKSKK